VVPPERLARIWQNIEADIDTPQPTILQRILVRFGLPTLVLTLAHAVANLPRPSLRILSGAASAVLLLITIGVVAYSTTNGFTPGSPEAASATSPSSHVLGNPISSPRVPITAADLPMTARSLVALPQNELTGIYLKPCQLAATGQRGVPLAVAVFPYRHEQSGSVLSAILVFRSPRALNLLDVYVVKQDCTGEDGGLLECEKNIPSTPYDWHRRVI